MTIISVSRRLPDYAKDIKNNLVKLFSGDLDGLTQTQVYGIALATGYYLKCERLLNDIRAEAKLYLEDADATACKKAVITASMLNNYYNFVNSVEDEELSSLPLDLDVESLTNPGVDMTDFILYSLAVSILSGHAERIKLHTKELLERDVDKVALHNVGRITSTLKAAADVIKIDELRSYEFVVREPSF